MKRLDPIQFSAKSAEDELKALHSLLKRKADLSERSDILPFFAKHRHLAALIGSYHPANAQHDRIAYEFSLSGDFTCDMVTGDSARSSFLLVEFEDGVKNSIFRKSGRANPHWSPRLEGAFGQVIDWMWRIDDIRQTAAFRGTFGESPAFLALIVIGRSQHLEPALQRRLNWRARNVTLGPTSIAIRTYDDLCADLQAKIDNYKLANMPLKRVGGRRRPPTA